MDELEKNIPDDFWRNAFNEASETPPTRVWGAIEHQLDAEKSPKVIPLWGGSDALSRPLLWSTGIAAAVALVLVGWWLGSPNTPATTTTRVAQVHAAKHSTQPMLRQGALASHVRHRQKPVLTEQLVASTEHRAFRSFQQRSTVLVTAFSQVDGQHIAVLEGPMLGKESPMRTAMLAKNEVQSTVQLPVNELQQTVGTITFQGVEQGTSIPVAKSVLIPASTLTDKSVSDASTSADGRSVETLITPAKRSKRDVWVSAGVMMAAFNPTNSLKSIGGVTNKPAASLAYQVSAGVQLTKRVSIETGVGYLIGKSTVDAPAVAAAYTTGNVNTLNNAYADAVRPGSYANSVSANPNVYTDRTTSTSKLQYVQVPVQVGYQLRPKKKLGLALIGGVITNIFTKNTVDNTVEITAKNNVYKPVSLAATMGARLRYRPSQHLSVSLAGVYQHALESGTKSDAQLQTKPTAAGMVVSADYHF